MSKTNPLLLAFKSFNTNDDVRVQSNPKHRNKTNQDRYYDPSKPSGICLANTKVKEQWKNIIMGKELTDKQIPWNSKEVK